MTPKQLQARCLEARLRGFTHVRIDPDVTTLDEWQAASALGLGVLSIERNACELEWLDYNHLRSMVEGPEGLTTGKMWSLGRQSQHRYESFPMQIGQHDWRVCVAADAKKMVCQWRAADSNTWHDQERWPTYDAQSPDQGLPRELWRKLWPREQATVQKFLGFNPFPELPEPPAAPEAPKKQPKAKAKAKAKTKRKAKRSHRIRALVRSTTRPASLH